MKAHTSHDETSSPEVPHEIPVILVPLNRLVASNVNVRKTGNMVRIEALAASIAADGLIQNLSVTPVLGSDPLLYAVVAGGRRLKALQLLVTQNIYASDRLITCRSVAADRAIGISLAENLAREAMHPSDQFEAFAALVDEGKTDIEIAARFGVTAAVVRDRLALARVAPEVIAAYREERIGLDQVMAFTLSNDHEQQRTVLANRRIPTAWEIKRLLTTGAVGTHDRRAIFVGSKAYVKAGGKTTTDLFASAKNEGIYFDDAGLLERLAIAKLEIVAEGLRPTWAWVETRTELEHTERSRFGSIPTIVVEPTQEQRLQLSELEATASSTREIAGSYQPIDDDDEGWAPLEEAAELAFTALQEVRDSLRQPDPNAAAYAGAVVTLDHAGKVVCHTGLIRPEDKAKVTAAIKTSSGNSSDDPLDSSSAVDPLPVRMNLSALRTAVVQDALAGDVDLALRTLAYAMVNSVLRMTFGAHTFGVHVRGVDKAKLDDLCPQLTESAVGKRNTERADMWETELPKDENALWQWCLDATPEAIRSLLAYATARTLDGVQRFPGSRDELGPIATALAVDMSNHWEPTPAYFTKVRKSDTLAALVGPDGKPPAELAKLKRDELAAEATKRLAGTGWLPPTLRNVA